MDLGHSVVLRPWASRYQLWQPPVVHTVRRIRFCRLRFQASVSAWVGSMLAMPRSFIVRIASRR